MQQNFETLEIVKILPNGPTGSLVVLTMGLLVMWLSRHHFIGYAGKWKFWIAMGVLATLAAFSSYAVVSQILQPQRQLLFSIAPDGIRCAKWADRVLPLNHVQDITTVSFGRSTSRTHMIYLDLNAAAPRYADETMNVERQARQLHCETANSDASPEDIGRIPVHWQKIMLR